MIARFFTWLRGLFSPRTVFIRPDTTEAEMEELRRQLERLINEHRGGPHG